MPIPIPWSVIGIASVIVLVGAVLALHGIGQREPNRIAEAGNTLVFAGAAFIGAVVFTVAVANGAVVLMKAMGDTAVQANAAAHPHPDAYSNR